MRGEPKPVVTSVRRYAADRNTQYREKRPNVQSYYSGRSEMAQFSVQGFLVGNRKESLKGRHGNLLSVRLNAKVKADYS
jgi:hypothetical protein